MHADTKRCEGQHTAAKHTPTGTHTRLRAHARGQTDAASAHLGSRLRARACRSPHVHTRPPTDEHTHSTRHTPSRVHAHTHSPQCPVRPLLAQDASLLPSNAPRPGEEIHPQFPGSDVTFLARHRSRRKRSSVTLGSSPSPQPLRGRRGAAVTQDSGSRRGTGDLRSTRVPSLRQPVDVLVMGVRLHAAARRSPTTHVCADK